MKRKRPFGVAAAACMLACCCTAPFPVRAEDTVSTRPGDANIDGSVDVADAVLGARFTAEDKEAVLTDQGRRNGDVNGDGELDGEDVRQILEFIARQRETLGTEQQPAEKLTKTVNLLDGLERTAVSSKQVDDTFRLSQYNLSVSLMQEIAKNEKNGGNMMISPLSFAQALSMAANGAKGETQAELTKLLGGELDMDALNQYYYDYTGGLLQSEKAKIDIANAVWFIDNDALIRVPQDYLRINKDYYDSDVFRSPFNEQTVKDINDWVSAKTDNMIPQLVNSLNPETVMMLVNAVYFDAEWLNPYEDFQVQDRWFYLSEGEDYLADFEKYGSVPGSGYSHDAGFSWPVEWEEGSWNSEGFVPAADPDSGSGQAEEAGTADGPGADRAVKAELMFSSESTYLENDSMTGFMRPYQGSGYSFVGLLPKKNTSVQECIANMTGDTLKELFANKEKCAVDCAIPKFSADFEVNLIPVMQALGVERAFDSTTADFTGLNEYGATWINKALQKTRIEVDEKGTRAAAVTGIGLGGGAMPMQSKEVILDHPFIYMIVDNRTELPLFIGCVMKPEWQ